MTSYIFIVLLLMVVNTLAFFAAVAIADKSNSKRSVWILEFIEKAARTITNRCSLTNREASAINNLMLWNLITLAGLGVLFCELAFIIVERLLRFVPMEDL